MTHRRLLYGVVAALLTAMLACSFPGVAGPTPDATAAFDAALTQAHATAQASVSGATGTPIAAVSPTSEPSATAAPSDTPTPAPPTASATATVCADSAQFITDVSVPDGTEFAAPTVFTKTWRVRNNGTCTWDTAYSLRFASGAQLGGPAAVAFPATVEPGHTLDLSVNLTSPAEAGTYTGRWRLTNGVGASFGTLTVAIGVPAPPTPTFTPTPTATKTPVPVVFVTPLVVPLVPMATLNYSVGAVSTRTCSATEFWMSFQISNTGGPAIESAAVRVEIPVGTIVAPGYYMNKPFQPGEASCGASFDGTPALAPGNTSWIYSRLSFVPPGGNGLAVFKLCSQDSLGGICKEVNLSFGW